jgi:hypothetical protein
VADQVFKQYLNEEANQYLGFMSESAERILDESEVFARESGDGIVRWKHKDDKQEVLEMVQELCDKVEPIINNLIKGKQYQTAFRFNAPIRIPYLDGKLTTIRLRGEMDLLTWDLDRKIFEVYDLKATRNEQYWRTTIGQTVFYDLSIYALHNVFTNRVGLIQPLCNRTVIDFEIDDSMRVECTQAIIRMCHDIWNNNHEMRPDTSKCWNCVVKNACARYKTKDGRVLLGSDITLDQLLLDLDEVPYVPVEEDLIL